MSNTLTSMTSTMIQDEVLPALKLGLLPVNSFSVGVADVPKNVGDSVNVPIVSAKSAGTYSTTYESGNSTTTGTNVALAAPTFSSWFVNPNLEAAASMERFLAQGKEAAYAVAKSVVQDVVGLYLAANIGDVADTDKKVVTAANYSSSDQKDLWKMLKTKGVAGTASAIHTIDYAAELFDDARLVDKSASGSDVLRTGELPSILGARQFYTDAFPTAITDENTGVIYTSPETAAVAFAQPADVVTGAEDAAGLRVMVVEDPETGIPLIWRQWLNTATGAYWGSVLVMHGQSFLRDAAVRIVSA